MMATSLFEILFFLLPLTAGNDLLAAYDPVDYFNSHTVPVTTEKMVELATTPAADGKAQIQQLLALRYLAEHVDTVKKAQNLAEIVKKIEEVAEGKKAKDVQGFAPAYARKAAMALGSTLKPDKVAIPENSLKQDALNCFPKSVPFVMAMDFRQEFEISKEMLETRQKLIKMLPPVAKTELYKFGDEVGNVRIDRIAFGYIDDPQKNGDNSRIYVRLTGKVNHKQLVANLKKLTAQIGMQFKEMKSFRGQPIGLFWQANQPPAFALIGDTDFILAGPNRTFGNPNAPDSLKMIEEMLDVQRGKLPSLLDGPLGAKVKQTSGTATGIMAGEIPEGIRKSFMNNPPGIGPNFKAFPKEMVVEMHYNKEGLKFKATAEMANEADAKAVQTGTEDLVQLGLNSLKNPPPIPLPNPDKLIKGATDTLKSIKVEAKGKNLTGTVTVGTDLINAYMNAIMSEFGHLLNAAPVPGGGKAGATAFLYQPLTPSANIVACRHEERPRICA